ncbi:MAG: YebC/PmpR family DNA-binding transcriptional regulator [Phycisphaerae bacterium]|jgi:YebC/PmpR family DNA-binding regulatory protein|nr:YebC/PmpR family DNA-binding transcriptional regulator [Phycisphaerae bacterium]NIP50884.1 YebC/PmpR family DNA-binding transcriptional regulator [Phycisphaerae bacterium]NIS50080.1 YebC/PmpR family DNA-binding transcriptional regulator [Phycisphaerae bacterium]NIU07735.1 YebC/PmpR family DNA-binding transcriptional regulator [Phycisphaerae bacterium]NIU55359.1 YebC/PmpR family DNA-binding transcriptional regulator [Phycisphaerae bacterium]
MSGHSHWAGIKYKKAAADAKRGKIWSKIARMIIVAAKSGGGDPAANLSLRYAIDKGKAANMPKDTIEKAIKKGTGEIEGVSYEEVLYEGYGPSGVAIMVEALTDNRNRTTPEVKRIFEKHGGSLGATGCVNWMFSKKGLITVNTARTDEDQLFEIALNAGADDMENTGEVYEITCDPAAYEKLKETLKEKEIPTEVAEISMVPQNTVPANDPAIAKKIISLMEAFEDHEDVQNTYANFDIPDEVLSEIGSK